MTSFDDHLWSHLAERGAHHVSARRPGESATGRRPLIFGGTAGLAAAVAAVVVALSATNATTPADRKSVV